MLMTQLRVEEGGRAVSRGFGHPTDLYGTYISLSIQITAKFHGSSSRLGLICGSTHMDSICSKLTTFQNCVPVFDMFESRYMALVMGTHLFGLHIGRIL